MIPPPEKKERIPQVSLATGETKAPDAIDVKIKEFRKQKNLEQAFKESEEANKLKFKEHVQKKAAGSSNQILQEMAKLKKGENFFETMAEKGTGVTFDYKGMPMM